MVYRFLISLILLFMVTGCSYKQPLSSRSATIAFKTPTLKFYDKGFIERYENSVKLTIFNLGVVVIDMSIYKDKVCKNALLCYDGDTFNDKFLDKSYGEDFLYNLFIQDDIYFKDQKNGILIKVIYDKNEVIENNETNG
jgi:hypothetical protein